MELNKELYIKGVSDYLEGGKNIFDKGSQYVYKTISNPITITEQNTGIKIEYTATDIFSGAFVLYNLGLASKYAGKPITCSANVVLNSNTKGKLTIGLISNDGSTRNILQNGEEITSNTDDYSVSATIPSTISSSTPYLGLWVYFNNNATGSVSIEYSNLQVEEGLGVTSYEPHKKYVTEDYLKNGKNKANIPTHTIAGQGTDYRIVNIEQNTTYTLSCVKTRLSGVTITNGALIMFLKLDFYNGSTKISSATLPSAVSFTTGSRYLTYTFTTPANCDNILLNLGNNNGDNNKNTSVSRVMLNKGSTALPYEEYYGKYLNNADVINGILNNNQMWRFKSFSLSGATSYDLTFDNIEDLGQFSIVIINTITSSNSSTKIGFCRNFSTYSYSNIFEDHTGTDVITNVSRTAGNVLRITTSTTSSINVGVTYMRIFRQKLNKN